MRRVLPTPASMLFCRNVIFLVIFRFVLASIYEVLPCRWSVRNAFVKFDEKTMFMSVRPSVCDIPRSFSHVMVFGLRSCRMRNSVRPLLAGPPAGPPADLVLWGGPLLSILCCLSGFKCTSQRFQMRPYKRACPSVRPLVGWSVVLSSKSMKKWPFTDTK